MNTVKKLEIEMLPQDYSPSSLPEILKLMKKIKGDAAFVYERLNKPFFMETDRLIIRRFTLDDTEAVLALSRNRMSSSMKNFDIQWPTDKKGCKDATAYFAGEDIYYAVCLKPSMKLIGFIAYNSVNDDGILDLGHVWHTAYQNNNLDAEALSLMTQYAFEKLGVGGVSAGNPLNCKEQIAPLKTIGMKIIEIREKVSFVNDKNGNPIEFTGVKMLITREQWEANNTESYSPKNKPEILSMAEKAAEAKTAIAYSVKSANGGNYIDGIPLLKWGQWRDNSYCGCVSALLNAIGISASYEEVMGLSGVCWQAIMRDDWDPSSQMPQNGLLCEKNVGDALGISVYTLRAEKKIWKQTKKSIDNGVPVLMVGGRWAPEWTIACGYAAESEKDKFFGRTYFDCQNQNASEKVIEHQSTRVPENEIYTENGYFYFNGFPGVAPGALTRFYDKQCKPISKKQALKVSLEMCIRMFGQKPGEHHKFGYDAYDVLIHGFELEDADYFEICKNDQYHIGSLLDARRAASAYLYNSVALLGGENNARLTQTARLYGQMTENLFEAVPYEETAAVFNMDSNPVWDTARRRNLAAALKENKELERQARIIVEDILKNWEVEE
ncbi:MAG: GNAT family N-acetyltransferase [Oscillospiraceae bacterium]|jgi:RimJ/RimL family protein N-acetyltransferase|nr:GNAT family N-acetyltransferase [Oscillospiraceae bacterium]